MAQACSDEIEDMEEHLLFVARKLCCDDWKWLGRSLKIDHNVIENIDDHWRNRTDEKAFQVLIKWSQTQGKAVATKDALIKALRAIGKTSIANELAKRGKAETEQLEDSGINMSIEEETKPQLSASSLPLIPTTNGHNQVFQMLDKQLDNMYQNCVKNIDIFDRVQLADNIEKMQDLQELNKILESYSKDNDNVEEEIKRSRRIRTQQTDQAIRCMLYRMKCTRPNTSRPRSEILQRCTSVVSLERRSDTFSIGSTIQRNSTISPPIVTSNSNFLSRTESRDPSLTLSIQERICEENSTNTELQLIPRCQSCGCCNVEPQRSQSSEHQDMTVDENCNQITLNQDVFKEETKADHNYEEETQDSKM